MANATSVLCNKESAKFRGETLKWNTLLGTLCA